MPRDNFGLLSHKATWRDQLQPSVAGNQSWSELLGWHVCSTKLAQKIFVRGTNFLTKNDPKFCQNILSLYFVGPTKCGKSSRQTSLPKIKKKAPTSFCRSAGRTISGATVTVRLIGSQKLPPDMGRQCLAPLFRPRNPCTTPTESTINIASEKLGVVAYFVVFFGSDDLHTPSPKHTT